MKDARGNDLHCLLNGNFMRAQKHLGLLFLFAFLLLTSLSSTHAQTKKPAVRLHFDTKEYAIEAGQKNFLKSFKLYTVMHGRRHFIEQINKGIPAIPEPLLDPSGKCVFYAINTGGGFENEGMTIFVSDVYGRKKVPILGRSWVLRPAGFLNLKGKTYLLITGESESPERDFWLYDYSAGRFILHADGEIRAIGKGLFSYGLNDEEFHFKELGKITAVNLINRTPPLRILPHTPTHGMTRKRNVRIYESDHCYSVDETRYKTIAAAGTRVLILGQCEDGGYAIYHNGFTGKVGKAALRIIEFKQP
jgi:hypothetical protein